MAKHTDGPWTIEEDDHGDWIVGSDGEGIAQLSLDVMDEEQRKADAHLIAASPLLLAYAECQEASSMYDASGNGFTKAQLDEVFVRHGLEAPVTHYHELDQLTKLRRKAIARGTGTEAEPR